MVKEVYNVSLDRIGLNHRTSADFFVYGFTSTLTITTPESNDAPPV